MLKRIIGKSGGGGWRARNSKDIAVVRDRASALWRDDDRHQTRETTKHNKKLVGDR